MQSSQKIFEPYRSNAYYAIDTIMTLALAMNETLQNPQHNLSLQTAIEAIRFKGVSVITIIMITTYIITQIVLQS